MAEKVLVSWIGGRDIDASNKGSTKSGPILSTLSARPHQQLHLLYNYPVADVEAYRDWLKEQLDIDVHLHKAKLRSPVHYGDIYESASKLMDALLEKHQKSDLSVLVSPGTPQMHSVWILMCKTQYAVPMLDSSEEQGVGDVVVPFDIAAEFVPGILAESDAALRRLSGGEASISPEFGNIITQNPVLRAQIIKAQKIAERDIPVLILGESGTGKELFARAIHRTSSRAKHNGSEPVIVNCGAIPGELVDSVLFGHVKGAFTGASSDRKGLFQEADGGTIFLDEFGELPPETQVRLLRVLQDGTFNQVGNPKDQKVDVRVIAATNRDLMAEIVEGNFREDLFYRVAVGIINLPPLREREGDLMLLTEALLEGINAEAASKMPDYKNKKLSAKAKKIIMGHGWPGNVRELQACLTRASVWAVGESITEREMREALLIRPAKSGDLLGMELDNTFDIQDVIKELKRHYIQKAMAETGGNKTRAAEKLGLKSYQVLNKWMEDIGLKE